MKLKNREVDIFGSKYSLEYVDKIESEDDMFIEGMCQSSAYRLQIAKKDFNNKEIDNSTHTRVLFHELIHAILNEGQYLQASSDEPMVEWMARCLTSLKEQKVI